MLIKKAWNKICSEIKRSKNNHLINFRCLFLKFNKKKWESNNHNYYFKKIKNNINGNHTFYIPFQTPALSCNKKSAL